MNLSNPSPARILHDEKQEAKRLGFSPRSLQAWRLKGGGPPYFKIGGGVRYDPLLSDAWLQTCIRANTSQGEAA
jgi:hypothetical protein